jgi:hypothetical protein
LSKKTADAALLNMAKAETSSPFYKKLTEMCESFISKSKTVVYGGTAINAILPDTLKFYNPEIDIPDYDIYSPTPIEHSKKIVDLFLKAGFEHAEAKSAVHFGTYKVYVDFAAVLDITYMPEKLFKLVKKNALKKDGMLFCHPDLLRQSIYFELSNTGGNVQRWEKILPRLHLLNEAYPVEKVKCKELNVHIESAPIDDELKKVLESVMISEKVVFLGGLAHSYYLPALSPSLKTESPGYYDIIVLEPKLFLDMLMKKLKEEGYKNVRAVKHAAVGELLGVYYELQVENNVVLNIFEAIQCYAYNEVKKDKVKIRIASFDTLLSFYFAFLYAELPHFDTDRIMCMANMLFEVIQENIRKQNGPLKRFPLNCYGKQSSLRSIKAKKWQLKKTLTKGTLPYKRWFFRYSPLTENA